MGMFLSIVLCSDGLTRASMMVSVAKTDGGKILTRDILVRENVTVTRSTINV